MAKMERVKNPGVEVSEAKLNASGAGLRAFAEGMGLLMHWGLYSALALHLRVWRDGTLLLIK